MIMNTAAASGQRQHSNAQRLAVAAATSEHARRLQCMPRGNAAARTCIACLPAAAAAAAVLLLQFMQQELLPWP
jgi:hypothetical protein